MPDPTHDRKNPLLASEDWWAVWLAGGVMIGAVVAIGMTLLFEAMNTRRSRLNVTLDMSSLQDLHDFLDRLASRLGWNEASTLRLRSAGEETLASLMLQEDDIEGPGSPRLIVIADHSLQRWSWSSLRQRVRKT